MEKSLLLFWTLHQAGGGGGAHTEPSLGLRGQSHPGDEL